MDIFNYSIDYLDESFYWLLQTKKILISSDIMYTNIFRKETSCSLLNKSVHKL